MVYIVYICLKRCESLYRYPHYILRGEWPKWLTNWTPWSKILEYHSKARVMFLKHHFDYIILHLKSLQAYPCFQDDIQTPCHSIWITFGSLPCFLLHISHFTCYILHIFSSLHVISWCQTHAFSTLYRYPVTLEASMLDSCELRICFVS